MCFCVCKEFFKFNKFTTSFQVVSQININLAPYHGIDWGFCYKLIPILRMKDMDDWLSSDSHSDHKAASKKDVKINRNSLRIALSTFLGGCFIYRLNYAHLVTIFWYAFSNYRLCQIVVHHRMPMNQLFIVGNEGILCDVKILKLLKIQHK